MLFLGKILVGKLLGQHFKIKPRLGKGTQSIENSFKITHSETYVFLKKQLNWKYYSHVA